VAAAVAADAIEDDDAAAEHPSTDAFGTARGGCAAARCAAYARPRLRPGANSALLLLCAACGGAAAEHARLDAA
jgi:hypothetical protein